MSTLKEKYEAFKKKAKNLKDKALAPIGSEKDSRDPLGVGKGSGAGSKKDKQDTLDDLKDY